MEADAVDGGDADGAGDDVFDFLEFALEGIISADDLLAVIVKDLAFTSEAEFFFAALNEQGFEEAFKGTNLLADRRLGDIVDLGGLGKALGFGQVTEDFEAVNLHKNMEY